MIEQVLFLPGASGNTAFWRPVAERLSVPARHVHAAYPGLGPTPPDPTVRSVHDLADRLAAMIDRPTAIVAQSMGCVLAVVLASRCPGHVVRLVLTAMSGGFDLTRFGAEDWRPPREALTGAPDELFVAFDEDLTPRLRAVEAPTLVLCGAHDAWSPPPVGHHVAALMPNARFELAGGEGHTFANTSPGAVASLIDGHLRGTTP